MPDLKPDLKPEEPDLKPLPNKWLVRQVTTKDKRNPLLGPYQMMPDDDWMDNLHLINDRHDPGGYYDEYPLIGLGSPADQDWMSTLWRSYLMALPTKKSMIVKWWWSHFLITRDAITKHIAELQGEETKASKPVGGIEPPLQTRQEAEEAQAEIRAALKAHDEELQGLDSRIWELEKAGHTSLGQMRSDRKSVAFKMPRRLMAGKHTQ